jgi:hypothetical protein
LNFTLGARQVLFCFIEVLFGGLFPLFPVDLDGTHTGGKSHQQHAEGDLRDDQDLPDSRHRLLPEVFSNGD